MLLNEVLDRIDELKLEDKFMNQIRFTIEKEFKISSNQSWRAYANFASKEGKLKKLLKGESNEK